MAKLSVNVNKIATLRNARGADLPNLVGVAKDIIEFGAHGITVHPRPDERHVRRADVFDLNRMIREYNAGLIESKKVEFNIEGYPSHDFISLVEEVNPDQCTLVPDPPEVLTSNAGWEVEKNSNDLEWAIGRLRKMGVRSSLFIDVFEITPTETDALLRVKPDRVELYTGPFAETFGSEGLDEKLNRYRDVALQFYDLGICINAGHDLNLRNVEKLIDAIPVIEEVSIGHALICEALYMGLENTVREYLVRVQRSGDLSQDEDAGEP